MEEKEVLLALLINKWLDKYINIVDTECTIPLPNYFMGNLQSGHDCVQPLDKLAFEKNNSSPHSLVHYKFPLKISKTEVYNCPFLNFDFTLCESLNSFEVGAACNLLMTIENHDKTGSVITRYEWPEELAKASEKRGVKSLLLYSCPISVQKPVIYSFPATSWYYTVNECCSESIEVFCNETTLLLEEQLSPSKYHATAHFEGSSMIASQTKSSFPNVRALNVYRHPVIMKSPLIYNFPKIHFDLFISECLKMRSGELECESFFELEELSACNNHITISYERPNICDNSCGSFSSRVQSLPTFRPPVSITKPLVLSYPLKSSEFIHSECLVTTEDGLYFEGAISTESSVICDEQLASEYDVPDLDGLEMFHFSRMAKSLLTYKCPISVKKQQVYKYPYVNYELIPIENFIVFENNIPQEVCIIFEDPGCAHSAIADAFSTLEFPVVITYLPTYNFPAIIKKPEILCFPAYNLNFVFEECALRFGNPEPLFIVHTKSPDFLDNHMASSYSRSSTFEDLGANKLFSTHKALTTFVSPVKIEKRVVLKCPLFKYEFILSEALLNFERCIPHQSVTLIEEIHFCEAPVGSSYEKQNIESLPQSHRKVPYNVKTLNTYRCPVLLHKPVIINKPCEMVILTPLESAVTFEEDMRANILVVLHEYNISDTCVLTDNPVIHECPTVNPVQLIYCRADFETTWYVVECSLMTQPPFHIEMAVVNVSYDCPVLEAITISYVKPSMHENILSFCSFPVVHFGSSLPRTSLQSKSYLDSSSREMSSENTSTCCVNVDQTSSNKEVPGVPVDEKDGNVNHESRAETFRSKKFALTGSSQGPLRELACGVLLEGSGLSILQEILSVYPEDTATTPEDVMMDTLHLLISHWKGEKIEIEVEAEGRDLLAVLDHILQQIKDYLENGGDLLSEEEVLDELRNLCQEESVPLKTKVDILTISEKYLSLNEADLQLVRVMKTGDVVGAAWPDDIISVKPEHLASGAARASLLDTLLTHINSIQQTQAIINLLKLWPPFGPEEYENAVTNPWILVLTKTMEVTRGNPIVGLEVIWESAQVAVKQNQLPRESMTLLVKKLQALGRLSLRYSSKVALLSEDEILHAEVLKNIKALDEVVDSDYDGELLNSIIEKKLLASVVSTPLYGPLINHLIESRNRQLVSLAVKQLQIAEYHQEAASLAFTQNSVPRILQNVTSVLKTYKKWL
ncbi:uncharacterized protein LOC135196168 isoform X1 [Macrobrachium nipponense]|uniref:uncharacterized protein LOC135196168 isoform X1 n=1 Tax=Macrobrachium nipponense TaxID=159736 RepID=UPI0030C7FF6A